MAGASFHKPRVLVSVLLLAAVAGMFAAAGGGAFLTHQEGRVSLARSERLLALAEARNTALEGYLLQMQAESRAEAEKIKQDFQAALDDLRRQSAVREAELTRALSAAGKTGAGLKQAFAGSRDAILFIRVEYEVENQATGARKTMTSFGTGFLVGADGTALTAQHVMYPWLYEKRLRALEQMELVRVLPETHLVTVWLAGQKVVETGAEDPRFLEENGYRNGGPGGPVRILFRNPPRMEEQVVASPGGEMAVALPVLGDSDVVVFRIVDGSRAFHPLPLAAASDRIGPLDQVLVVGFPFSRLDGGVASPQPAHGRVRRVARMLEIATPMLPGNSGGPVLNTAGEVVGLASFVVDSPLYGVALRAGALRAALAKARAGEAGHPDGMAGEGCENRAPGATETGTAPRPCPTDLPASQAAQTVALSPAPRG